MSFTQGLVVKGSMQNHTLSHQTTSPAMVSLDFPQNAARTLTKHGTSGRPSLCHRHHQKVGGQGTRLHHHLTASR